MLFAYLYILEWSKDSNQACRSLVGHRWGMSVSNVSLIGMNVGLWSLIRNAGLRPNISGSNKLSMWHVGLRWGMLVLDGSPLKHGGVSNEACWGLPSCMLVSDQANWSQLGLRYVSDESPIGLPWVSNFACRSQTGLQSCMLVSDGSSIGLR